MKPILLIIATTIMLFSCEKSSKNFAEKTYEDKNLNEGNFCIDILPIEFPSVDSTYAAGVLNSKIQKNLPKNQNDQQILNVRFLGGSEFVQSKVIKYAKMWEPYANIEFKFSNISTDQNLNPDIKISFDLGKGSWSYLGSDSKVMSPSMNYGWLTENTSEAEFSRVILHEFGHALGLIHEHQNPNNNTIQWNREVVYKYYSGSPNYWSKPQIESNILDKYSSDQINGSAYDPNSIMLYSFPSSFTLNGIGTKQNNVLSEMDKKVINRVYSNN